MPKKFGINTKSSEAKARKAEVKNSKVEIEKKTKEDIAWADSHKLLEAKEERKREAIEKKQREKERKEENKRIAEQEAETLSKKVKSTGNGKLTRAQIEAMRLTAIANMQAQIKKEEEEKADEILKKIDEDINPNHIIRDERARLEEKGAVLVESSQLGDAVNLLEEEKAFKHPEKKVKRAWKEFIEENLNTYKRENPHLKRSQLLDIMHDDFEKSEKNPFNMVHVDYNSKIN